MNVIENCAAKLETSIRQFLVSSMSGDSRPLKCEIDYHAVLYDIYRCAPQILSGVVPYLTGELLVIIPQFLSLIAPYSFFTSLKITVQFSYLMYLIFFSLIYPY